GSWPWHWGRQVSAGRGGQLEETGGGLRAPGDSVLLSCRGYGFNFRVYTILWYRQAPGGGFEWVSSIHPQSTETAAAVEGRVNVSRDNSRSEASLSLSALQPQDSARYYCAAGTHRKEKQLSFNRKLLCPPRVQKLWGE
uniref:Uncharacterized protein n=1 Tax=Melopsittacus undulatus TaxID=13146 RepID=A0A8C6IQ34_MELUD